MSAWSVVVISEVEQQQHLSYSEPTLALSSLPQAPVYYQNLIQQDLGGAEEFHPEGQVFFAAPATYIGNHVTSYGGYLTYSLVFVRGDDG